MSTERRLKQFRVGHLNGQADMRARLLLVCEEWGLLDLRAFVLSLPLLDPFSGDPFDAPPAPPR